MDALQAEGVAKVDPVRHEDGMRLSAIGAIHPLPAAWKRAIGTLRQVAKGRFAFVAGLLPGDWRGIGCPKVTVSAKRANGSPCLEHRSVSMFIDKPVYHHRDFLTATHAGFPFSFVDCYLRTR